MYCVFFFITVSWRGLLAYCNLENKVVGYSILEEDVVTRLGAELCEIEEVPAVTDTGMFVEDRRLMIRVDALVG